MPLRSHVRYLQVGSVYTGIGVRAYGAERRIRGWTFACVAGLVGETQATSIWSDCLDTYVAGWAQQRDWQKRSLALEAERGPHARAPSSAGASSPMPTARAHSADGSASSARPWGRIAPALDRHLRVVVNLHPASAVYSLGYATDGSTQVGEVYPAGIAHAALWQGTAASWVDLHPATASSSTALGVGGGQQAGWRSSAAGIAPASGPARPLRSLTSTRGHHRLRPTTSMSAAGGRSCEQWHHQRKLVDRLRGLVGQSPPAGPYSSSWAYGVGGGQQVGASVTASRLALRALWTGSAGSL